MVRLKDHLFPTTAEEAVEMLSALGGRGRILAGGTDLVEKLREGDSDIDVFVDIRRIEDMKSIALKGDHIIIGAGVTHAQVATSDLVKKEAGVLAEACLSVGGPQIRNLGTLAGNVVSAQPAADGSLALASLSATLTVLGLTYRHEMDIANAFAGPGVSKIDATKEVITEIAVPIKGERRGSNYQRLAMRRSLSLPMVAAAAVVDLEEKRFKRVRLAVGPMAPTPLVVSEIDDLLRGKSVSRRNISKAVEILGRVAQPRDSLLRGSRDYRLSMVQVLAYKAVMTASLRAQGIWEERKG